MSEKFKMLCKIPYEKATFETNLAELKKNLGIYLAETKNIPKEVFTGPSAYFHEQAIKAARGKDYLQLRHKEMIYAMLPAWGMHHTGNHPVGVIGFEEFDSEIDKLVKSKVFEYLQQKTILSNCQKIKYSN